MRALSGDAAARSLAHQRTPCRACVGPARPLRRGVGRRGLCASLRRGHYLTTDRGSGEPTRIGRPLQSAAHPLLDLSIPPLSLKVQPAPPAASARQRRQRAHARRGSRPQPNLQAASRRWPRPHPHLQAAANQATQGAAPPPRQQARARLGPEPFSEHRTEPPQGVRKGAPTVVAEHMGAVRPRADIGASKIPLPRDQRDGLPALPSHGTNGPTAALGDSADTATPESTQPGPRALQRSNSNRHT